MTFAIFVSGLLLAWAYWAAIGFFVFDGVTIYVCLFIATLTAASAEALLTREWRLMVAAGLLIVNFAWSHYAWSAASPFASASFDVLTAAWFVLFGIARWEFGIGAMFLVSALSGVLQGLGLLPARPAGAFLAFSYPDITSLCGHAANIILGAGAGDAGRRVKSLAHDRAIFADIRLRVLARIYPVAPMARQRRKEGS